jgi:hypothetical protein
MILKASLITKLASGFLFCYFRRARLSFLAPCLVLIMGFLFSHEAWSYRRIAIVLETSTSGKLVRVNVGARQGLRFQDAVLFSSAERKVALGRAIQVNEDSAVIAILQTFRSEPPSVDSDYDLLFGEPFPEAENLPDYIIDRSEERDNPANETFLEREKAEQGPELDDDSYTPEISLRPRFPDPRTYSPHNITVGIGLFRNRVLATELNPTANEPGQRSFVTYQGYTLRYAYTWRSHYWLQNRMPALLSVEGAWGVYNFSHTFPDDGSTIERVGQIRVMPVSLGLRYLWEVSKLFRLYPYVGYQHNIVSAIRGTTGTLAPLSGGRLYGGAGAQLVMSNTIDARLEGGSDGVMGGLVVKF